MNSDELYGISLWARINATPSAFASIKRTENNITCCVCEDKYSGEWWGYNFTCQICIKEVCPKCQIDDISVCTNCSSDKKNSKKIKSMIREQEKYESVEETERFLEEEEYAMEEANEKLLELMFRREENETK